MPVSKNLENKTLSPLSSSKEVLCVCVVSFLNYSISKIYSLPPPCKSKEAYNNSLAALGSPYYGSKYTVLKEYKIFIIKQIQSQPGF